MLIFKCDYKNGRAHSDICVMRMRLLAYIDVYVTHTRSQILPPKRGFVQ